MVNINVFSQILSLINREVFNLLVRKYDSDKHHKGINSWTHLVSMLFCHLSSADSVRDISNGLRSTTGNMRHMGISRVPSKSNLSYMNAHRDHSLFRDLYYRLLDDLWQKQTHRRSELRQLKRQVFLMDATVIPLCLSVFDWARFRSAKGAVKLHTILNYEGCMPSFVHITDGKTHEATVAKTISFPKGCVVVVDRGYVDYAWMNVLDSNECFFVTRSKSNMKYTVVRSWKSEELREAGIIEDQIIELDGTSASRYGGKRMRLVRVLDSIKNIEYQFLTNNFQWKPQTVSALYKERWEIETFFKHLKQRLKVNSFVGTSENAVYIQIWTALIGILLFKYIQKRAKYSWNLSNLVNFIKLNIFVKIDLWKWADDPFISGKPPDEKGQFVLF
ncbi:IS4 family transposase [Sphingobacterium sp. JB170]|uniref:IS4 family transposase n=1 Tax=Sphingobacterium sp. JB170 TaxID=1434842 RepID=UPI00097E9C2F|nr:IS4 family transposase [Sphingobacterium sp. JB170]SJN49762.1 Mobile element protein [Sphingobacterium sp. JB170]